MVKTETKASLLDTIINLRATVLALGESSDPPWWRTKFMNDIGIRFLERIYPRSYFHAALNAAGKAARDTHHHSAGKVGVYHLFRLPEGLEADIHSHMNSLNSDFFAEFIKIFADRNTLMERLKSVGNIQDSEESVAGALRIGDESDCRKIKSYKKAASFYYTAFQNGKQVYPYFSADGSNE